MVISTRQPNSRLNEESANEKSFISECYGENPSSQPKHPHTNSGESFV